MKSVAISAYLYDSSSFLLSAVFDALADYRNAGTDLWVLFKITDLLAFSCSFFARKLGRALFGAVVWTWSISAMICSASGLSHIFLLRETRDSFRLAPGTDSSATLLLAELLFAFTDCLPDAFGEGFFVDRFGALNLSY